MREQAENLRRHHPYTGGGPLLGELVEAVISMAITIQDLQSKLSTQASALSSAESRIAALEAQAAAGSTPPAPAPDLQPIADAIDANTARVDALGVPTPAPTDTPAAPTA
jgi:hypothetical protein